MFKTVKFVLAASAVATLVACGGGGGSAPAATASSVASTLTFQLRTANANAFQQTSTLPFTVSGTISGFAVTGSGSVTRGNVTSTTFETQTALQKVTTSSGTYTANGTSVPISTVGTGYVDSNYLPIGSSGMEYVVVQGVANLPPTALVNDTGNVFTAIRYTNSSKTSTVGTLATTFTLLPDTATTALIRITYIYKDNSSAVTQTETTVSRISATGTVNYVSDTVTYPNGNNLALIY